MLDLVPIDEKSDHSPPPAPTPASAPAPSRATNDAGISAAPEAQSVDKFVAAATVEFEKGNIDQPLWDHALAQSKNDRVTAISYYLNARATSLRVLERDRRGRAGAAASTDQKRQPPGSLAPEENGKSTPARRRNGNPRLRQYAALGIAGVVIVLGAAGYFVTREGAPTGAPTRPSGAASPAVAATPAARTEAAKVNAKAADRNSERKAISDLIDKIESLRSAGNWNVHVLYAREWTRKEPLNAAAWNELGIGFEKLRQFDDAYAAAQKAVELAPENALYWRNLGLLDVELNLPDEALNAFGHAVAANDQDIQSLVQIGLLNVRLGRLTEAKVMLDKALLANSDDNYTQCLKTLLARGQPAPKSPATAGRQVEAPLKAMCRDPSEVAAPPPVASTPVTPPKAPARGKR